MEYDIALAAGRVLAARAECAFVNERAVMWGRQHGDSATAGHLLPSEGTSAAFLLASLTDKELEVEAADAELREALLLHGHATLRDALIADPGDA